MVIAALHIDSEAWFKYVRTNKDARDPTADSPQQQHTKARPWQRDGPL